MALQWRRAAAMGAPRSAAIARRSFATVQHRSVQVEVADGVSLHAIVPETTNGDAAAKTEFDVPVLCLPSSFGSVTENFRFQYEALGDKYTFIGVDPRGYGKSRPPERDFPDNYFERDADDVAKVMDTLGYGKVSILGWSAGANVGAVFAAKYPERVSRLVLVNGNAFVSDEDVGAYEQFEDVSKWHPVARAEGEAIYGAENLQKGWSAMMQKLKSVYEADGDLYCGFLPRIKCKTLVVAGESDKLVESFHGEYLSERIMHSRLHLVENGRHDLHIQDAAAFNELLHTFLQEPDDKLTQSREYVARPTTSTT
ncbi:Phospholipase ddhd2 isoform 1 [Globisporangium polare]